LATSLPKICTKSDTPEVKIGPFSRNQAENPETKASYRKQDIRSNRGSEEVPQQTREKSK